MTEQGASSPWSLRDLRARPGPIVVAGNLSLDDTINPRGETLEAPGGDALYAALGARIWGADVKILTLAGEDYPEAYLARIREAGIGTDLIRRVAGRTVHYRVVDDASGARTYVHLSGEDRLEATSPEARDYQSSADWAWLHLAAMPIRSHQVGIAAARREHVPVSLDPHEEYIVGYETLLADLVRGTAFMPSELEVDLLFPDLVGLGEEIERAQAAAIRLVRFAPTWTAIKVGAEGSLVTLDGRHAHVLALNVSAVDQIGAGDAYCGGMVAGLVRTGSLLAAAACGTTSAAYAITQVGALPSGPWPQVGDLVARAAEVLAGRFDGEGDRALDLIRTRFFRDGT